MTYYDHKKVVAISTGDHKQAALFFEKIFPMHSYNDVPSKLKVPIETITETKGVQIKTFIESVTKSNKDKLEILLDDSLINFLKKNTDDNDDVSISGNFSNRSELFKDSMRDIISLLCLMRIEDQGLYVVPIFETKQVHGIFTDLTSDITGSSDAVEITLGNINLIKTDLAQWSQILELKKDEDAKRKLRNFRLFLYDNYEDKSKALIKDSLDKKIEDYEQACKKHGFELVTSSISTFLDSKSLLGISGIATVGILAGIPAVTSIAALTGAVIETGKIAINIVEKKFKFRSFKKNHELAYIFEAKRKLEK